MKTMIIRCAGLSERVARQSRVASCHLGDRAFTRYCYKMNDVAAFIAPALLVAYLAVGCLLLWGRAWR
jgi:hypothetical protein